MKQSLKRFRIPPHIWVKYSIAIFIASVAVLIIAFACYESGSYSDGTIIFFTVLRIIGRFSGAPHRGQRQNNMSPIKNKIIKINATTVKNIIVPSE